MEHGASEEKPRGLEPVQLSSHPVPNRWIAERQKRGVCCMSGLLCRIDGHGWTDRDHEQHLFCGIMSTTCRSIRNCAWSVFFWDQSTACLTLYVVVNGVCDVKTPLRRHSPTTCSLWCCGVSKAILNQLGGMFCRSEWMVISCEHSQTHLVLRACPSYLQSLAGSSLHGGHNSCKS